MSVIIEEKYREKCATPSDIYEHLPTLRRYAAECRHITELGVRTVVSTWALLAGLENQKQKAESRKPVLRRTEKEIRRTLVSVDIAAPEKHGGNWNEVMDAADAAGITLHFIEVDDRTINLAETDLLFIDTWHVYEQLQAELERHAARARRWIILHDTETFGVNGETAGHDGLNRAVTEFLCTPGCPWRVREHFRNCNGLTVLERLNATR